MKSLPVFRLILIFFAGVASTLLLAQVLPQLLPSAPLSEAIVVDRSAPVRNGPLGGYAPIVAQISPAVVSITSSSQVPVARNRRTGELILRELPGGLGSGVIISAEGHLLTNFHVISQQGQLMERVFAQLSDGREFEAKVLGVDSETDIALLKINAQNLPAATLGDSAQLLPGDTVLAIGNPFGLEQTVTSGIVSAIGRTDLQIGGDFSQDEEFIQTDASINPGNSGGALVDNQGRVIGINTAIYSRTGGNVGIGFAIPINQAVNIAAQLMEFGEVRRGYLGIASVELNTETAERAREELGIDLPAQGVLVLEVGRNTPADKAGLRPHDTIIAINGKVMKAQNQFTRMIANTAPGTQVNVLISRNGQERQLKVTLGDR